MQEQIIPSSVAAVEGVYDPSGLLLSVIVSIAASYVAFSMLRRLQSTDGRHRWHWYLGAALTLGVGTWTMHFIGMIALQLPFPVEYHKGLTLLSLLIAILGSLIVLHIVVIYTHAWQRFVLGSVVWVVVISSMHFLGMAAMVMPASMAYDGWVILLSILVSVAAASVALFLLCKETELNLPMSWKCLASASVMGLSISSMHYLAMWGTHFVPDEPLGRIFLDSYGSNQLHWPLAIGMLFFLYLMMELSIWDSSKAQRNGIGLRLRMMVIVMVSVTGLSVGILSMLEVDAILEGHGNKDLRLELEGEAEAITELFIQLQEDAHFISRTPGINVLLKALATKESEAGVFALEKVRQRVSELLKDFLAGRPDYQAIAIIGREDSGRELIRAERQGVTVSLIDKAYLIPKAGKANFQETMNLPPGQIHISEINFSHEGDEDASVKSLIMQIAVPVYLDKEKLAAGMVLIDTNLSQIFKPLTKSEQFGDRDLVTDQTGRLLTFRDPTLKPTEQGDQFIQIRYPFLAEVYEKNFSGDYFTTKVMDGGERLYVHVKKVALSDQYPDRNFVLVEILPVAYIDQQLRPLLNQTFITTLLLILLSIPLALWLVRQIVNPLNKLVHSMEQLAGGDIPVNFPVSKIHEIHQLSASFNRMREEVNFREIALAEAEERMRSVVEHVAEGIITVDSFGLILSLNGVGERMFGYDDKEVLGKNVSILMPEPYRSNHDHYIKQYRMGNGGASIGVSRKLKAQSKDGHIFPIELTITVIQQGGEDIFIGLIRDITERQLARQQERLASKVMENSLESIVITDTRNRIQYVNPAFCEITGYSFAEAIGKNPSFLASGRHDGVFYGAMWKSINEQGSWQGEIWDRRKDGTLYLKWLSITAIEDRAGEVTNYVGIASDITERKQSEERLKDLAHHDQLTGLPNRQLFNDRLTHAIIQSARSKTKLALLFIDLDRFKGVNDTYGHDVGDKLLIEIAERILGRVREGDTVARLGGDEFTLILPEIKEAANAVHIAQTILDHIDQPVFVDGHDCSVGASVGISFFPEDGADPGTLLRHADIAMYRAKSHGGSSYSLFDKEMEESAARRLTLEIRLRSAIESNQFFLNYQPIINGRSGEPVGFEALIRWQVPGMGVVGPNEFIPLAEETGQIVEIGDWVLEMVCRQLVEWRSQQLTLLPVAVNISTRQLLERDFVGHIKMLLQRYELNAGYLELELTETTLMKYPDECQSVLESCKEFGLKIAIDDFGTGYSSLAYLKQLPINKLKIDRSFIIHLEENHRSRAIIDSVVHLARGLEMQVVAEGVETPGQLAMLRDLECENLQGFLFSKPVSAEIAAEILSESRVYC